MNPFKKIATMWRDTKAAFVDIMAYGLAAQAEKLKEAADPVGTAVTRASGLSDALDDLARATGNNIDEQLAETARELVNQVTGRVPITTDEGRERIRQIAQGTDPQDVLQEIIDEANTPVTQVHPGRSGRVSIVDRETGEETELNEVNGFDLEVDEELISHEIGGLTGAARFSGHFGMPIEEGGPATFRGRPLTDPQVALEAQHYIRNQTQDLTVSSTSHPGLSAVVTGQQPSPELTLALVEEDLRKQFKRRQFIVNRNDRERFYIVHCDRCKARLDRIGFDEVEDRRDHYALDTWRARLEALHECFFDEDPRYMTAMAQAVLLAPIGSHEVLEWFRPAHQIFKEMGLTIEDLRDKVREYATHGRPMGMFHKDNLQIYEDYLIQKKQEAKPHDRVIRFKRKGGD